MTGRALCSLPSSLSWGEEGGTLQVCMHTQHTTLSQSRLGPRQFSRHRLTFTCHCFFFFQAPEVSTWVLRQFVFSVESFLPTPTVLSLQSPPPSANYCTPPLPRPPPQKLLERPIVIVNRHPTTQRYPFGPWP